MQFDLRRFIAAGSTDWSRDFACDMTGRDFAGARIPEPVQAHFSAVGGEGELRLALRASAWVDGECARCLDRVSFPVEVSAEWTVRERELDDPDFELPLDEAARLDADEWLYQELLFEIPPVLLCSDGCQGLCPQCGRRRPCTCACPEADKPAGTLPDARLSVLKSLLNG